LLDLLLRVPLDAVLLALLLVPGMLVARLARPLPTPLQAVSETLLCSLVVVAVPAFSAALLSRSFLAPGHLLVWAVLVSVAAGLVLHRRAAGGLREVLTSYAPAPAGDRAALLAGVAVFLLFAANYDRQHFQYACINGVVMQAITADAAPPIDPHEEDGPVHSRPRSEGARMDLIDQPGTGQRYGTTTVITPWVVLFDGFGFRLVYALLPLLALLFGFRLARIVCPRPRLALLAAALALCNPYVLKIVILDENVMAMCFATAALALVLEGGPMLLAGLALGITLGIRHVDLPLALALAVLVGRKPRQLLALGATAAVALLPCFLHHQASYGSPFSHEHFIDEVFQAVPHSFLFWQFDYTGLLNIPFAEQWIRTPYNPFPTSLYYPLNVAAHLGSLLSALVLLGGFLLVRRRRKLALALALWAVPLYSLLAVLENWMDPNKMGLILCLFPLLTLALAAAFDGLVAAPDGHSGNRRWLSLAVLTGVVSCAAMAAGQLDVADDQRFYAKYPEVRRELPAYLDFERSLVTRGSPLPSLYALQQYTRLRPLQRLGALGRDYLDRRLRRPAVASDDSAAASPGAELRTVRLDLGTPWVGRRDFVGSTGVTPWALDLSQAGAGYRVTGLSGWDAADAEVRVVRDGPSEVSLYLRFGGEPFAEVQSERLFSIEEVQRPNLQERSVRGARLSLQLREGDRLRLYETISMDEVLVYFWELEVGSETLDPGVARRMFHN